MDIFNILTLIGGLSLFLFGMNVMGESLERRAGGSLRSLLSKLTTGKAAGFLTGLAVTAVIQSSSATTVMVVGFVNSGLMTAPTAPCSCQNCRLWLLKIFRDISATSLSPAYFLAKGHRPLLLIYT